MDKSSYQSTSSIGTFADYIHAKKYHLPIREQAEVAVNVPFWDEAIDVVLTDIRNVAGAPIDYGRLVDYLKVKYAIIDRNDLTEEIDMVSAHIRELLFNHYGDSMLSGEMGAGFSTAEMGTKALVLSQLTSTIYQIVLKEAGLMPEQEPEEEQKPVATFTLDTGCDDELPFDEYKVACFDKFSDMLKESVSKITCENDERCYSACLKELKSKAGSLDIDDILKLVEKEEYTTVEGYISSIVEHYLKENEIELNGTRLKTTGRQGTVLNQARKVFAYQIVTKIMSEINKETLGK